MAHDKECVELDGFAAEGLYGLHGYDAYSVCIASYGISKAASSNFLCQARNKVWLGLWLRAGSISLSYTRLTLGRIGR